MRMRTALVAALFVMTAAVSTGRQDASPKVEVRLKGEHANEALASKAPASGVIVSEKAWKELVAAWDVKTTGPVDFSKTIMTVSTTRGSRLTVSPKVKDGNLEIGATSTRDLKPGFRYEIVSVPREGVKTVNGQPLPKE